MIKTVKTGLYASTSPLEWATIGNGILFTAQIPIDNQGQVVSGGIEAQTRQTMRNLCHTLECANASLTDVTQVMIYVTDRAYLPVVNGIYAEYFGKPIPIVLPWSLPVSPEKRCSLSWLSMQQLQAETISFLFDHSHPLLVRQDDAMPSPDRHSSLSSLGNKI